MFFSGLILYYQTTFWYCYNGNLCVAINGYVKSSVCVFFHTYTGDWGCHIDNLASRIYVFRAIIQILLNSDTDEGVLWAYLHTHSLPSHIAYFEFDYMLVWGYYKHKFVQGVHSLKNKQSEQSQSAMERVLQTYEKLDIVGHFRVY